MIAYDGNNPAAERNENTPVSIFDAKSEFSALPENCVTTDAINCCAAPDTEAMMGSSSPFASYLTPSQLPSNRITMGRLHPFTLTEINEAQ